MYPLPSTLVNMRDKKGFVPIPEGYELGDVFDSIPANVGQPLAVHPAGCTDQKNGGIPKTTKID